MRRWTVAVLAVALAVPPVLAASLADVTLPDEVVISGKTLKLNGMGLREKMWVDVYVAGFYLEQPTAEAATAIASQQIKRVVMHFLTNKATKSKMDNAWTEGFEGNSPDQLAALKGRLDTFKGFFGNMKDGDRVEITMEPGKGTVVSFNGTEKGAVEGDDFAQALLRVWLGNRPPSEDLKAGMLGGSR